MQATQVFFCGVPLLKNTREREINVQHLYQGLVDHMAARCLSADDKRVRDLVTMVTDKHKYQGLFLPEVGEQELRDLCTKFKLSYSDTKQGYRDFKNSRGNIVSSQFRPLLHAINTIPISTAACEHGFSVVNDVCTPLRSLLTVPHLSALIFIKIVGPPTTDCSVMVMWSHLSSTKQRLCISGKGEVNTETENILKSLIHTKYGSLWRRPTVPLNLHIATVLEGKYFIVCIA